MRPQLALRSLVIGVTATLALTACGGDDVFPRDEFVQQTVARGIKKPVAECTYDQIRSNTTIMKELNRAGGPNSNISEKVSDQLGTILARCLLAEEDQGTTTTTPTSKDSSSKTTDKNKSTTTTEK